MARSDGSNPRFLPVDLARQLLPGTFEPALNHLLDHEIDLSGFDKRFVNDLTGALAYPPAMLLKVVLFAYAQGIVSSRGIERACREHVTFIALCGDTRPHFGNPAHRATRTRCRATARLARRTPRGPSRAEGRDPQEQPHR